MKFFTSDFHIDHKNIIKYCNRPFNNIESMQDWLMDEWNNKVKDEDTVYFLGDFCLNHKSADFVQFFNGKKILIHGNHDLTYPFSWNKKQFKMHQYYLDNGWNSIHNELIIKIKNYEVLLSHFPYQPLSNEIQKDLRYLEYRPKFQDMIHLHGHTHGLYLKNNNQIDVSIDSELKIFSEDDIIKLIEDKKEFIPSRLTNWYKDNEKNKIPVYKRRK